MSLPPPAGCCFWYCVFWLSLEEQDISLTIVFLSALRDRTLVRGLRERRGLLVEEKGEVMLWSEMQVFRGVSGLRPEDTVCVLPVFLLIPVCLMGLWFDESHPTEPVVCP